MRGRGRYLRHAVETAQGRLGKPAAGNEFILSQGLGEETGSRGIHFVHTDTGQEDFLVHQVGVSQVRIVAGPQVILHVPVNVR